MGTSKIRYSEGLGWSEKSETWWIHVRIGGATYTRDTGKRHRRDAETWLFNFRRERELEIEFGAIPDLTVEEGLRLWAKNVALEPTRSKPPKASTIHKVVRAYELWVIPKIGSLVVARLNRKDLQDVVIGYRNASGPQGAHTEEGVRNFIINLNIPLRWLFKTERVIRLPRLPQIPKLPRKAPVVVAAEKFPLLLERYDRMVHYDIYARLYIRMMALVGLRTGNARSLRKDMFREDFSAFNTGITKNGNEYFLPLPEDIQSLLKLVPDMGSPTPLFPSNFGESGHGDHWCWRALERASKAVGVSLGGRWHAFRRTYATALVESGTDVFVLMELMGWETVSVALRYVATRIEHLAKAQGAAANHLLSGGRINSINVVSDE